MCANPTFLTTPLIASQCGQTRVFLQLVSTRLKTADSRPASFLVIGCAIARKIFGRSAGGSSTREQTLQMHCSTLTVVFM